ncbi:MAG: response regulator [Burkholderiales bacterium]|nr:response regulator [Burkholderiales bacterium]
MAARIRLLAVACIVPAWLLAVLVLYQAHQRERAALVQATVAAAQTLARSVDRELATSIAVLQTLALSPLIDDQAYERFHQVGQQVLRQSGATNIVLLDTERRGLVSLAHPEGRRFPALPTDRFPQVMSSRRPGVSDLFVGQISGQQQVAVAVPVLRGEQVIGRLEMVISAQRMSALLREQAIPEGWLAAVVDRQGVLVARNRQAADYVGKPATERLRQAITQATEGHFANQALDGTAVLTCFSRAPDTGWTAVIAMPQSVLDGALRSSLLMQGAGALALLAAGLVLAQWLGQRLAGPIQALVQPALAIGRGETTQVAPSGLREADDLAAALNQASQLLQQRDQAREQAEELRLHGQRLAEQNRQMQEASRLKNEFLANMSHELRTPLNAVIGFADILQRLGGSLPEAKRLEYLQHIGNSGRHLLRMINDVLDLSKVEAGRFEIQPEPLQLAPLVHGLCGVLQAEAARKQITLHTELDPAVDDLVLDPARLKQMLYNYLSNAIKFTPDGGQVILRARPEGPQALRIEVEDTGIGIAAEDLDRLFQPFQQLHSGLDKRHTGTGLGLVLTRRLAELHGGSAGVHSTPGVGSVFHLLLPRRAGAEAGPLAAPPAPAPAVAEAGVPGPEPADAPRVLVIEDDSADRARLAHLLRQAGYRVDLADSGEAALRLAGARRYDAITLDLLLPDRSGLDLLAELRSSGRHDEVPVLVITCTTDTSALAGMAVSDVLAKPIQPDQVIAALRRAGCLAGRRPSVMVVDDDPAARALITAALQPLGVAVLDATDGADALARLGQQQVDALIIDLMMPRLNGFELLAQLRSQPHTRLLPVFVWTSLQLSPQEQQALLRSARAVASKAQAGLEALLVHLQGWRASHVPPADGGQAP